MKAHSEMVSAVVGSNETKTWSQTTPPLHLLIKPDHGPKLLDAQLQTQTRIENVIVGAIVLLRTCGGIATNVVVANVTTVNGGETVNEVERSLPAVVTGNGLLRIRMDAGAKIVLPTIATAESVSVNSPPLRFFCSRSSCFAPSFFHFSTHFTSIFVFSPGVAESSDPKSSESSTPIHLAPPHSFSNPKKSGGRLYTPLCLVSFIDVQKKYKR